MITKMFGRKDKPRTAQQSIPYIEMYRDGICRVTERLYTKTVVFGDINYHLAQNEDKTRIFENYCDWLNYFDSSISLQISAINKYSDGAEILKSINIPMTGDDCDLLRVEYSDILKYQQAKGNNGLVKSKYVTFGIEADSLKAAKLRLERVEADILNNFKILGVTASSLSGMERLEILHGQFHVDGADKFSFNWNDIPHTGQTTKDYIAPTSFDFRQGKTFGMGAHYGAASYLQILAPELTDRMLADFLELDFAVTVTLHIQSIDQSEAIKTIKRKLSDLDKMKIEEQKRAVRSGYDMDIIPSDLATYGNEAKSLLEDLQSRNERMFLVTVLVMNTAKTKSKLENDVFAAAGVAQKYNCVLKRLDWQQEQALMSSLPLGLNQIEIKRGLTTSSVAIFVPFTTCELFQTGEALYYGLNTLSNNLIMANRKLLRSANGLFLGTPGSGKSFAAKREIVNVFLLTGDDIIISDPEAEYFPLVNRLGGQVIKLSPTSSHYINPMDINPDYDDEDPLTLKSDFILSLCELIIGGKTGLEPVEKTIIDRCVRLVYRDFLTDPDPAKMPTLEDLYNLLRKQGESEAQRIATALEIYVTGSLNVFCNRTNVDIKNRLVCYDIKELGKGLKKIAMLILQDAVWNRVSANRNEKKTTWFYQDEFHLMLKEEQTAAYSVEIWKRFRKWGGVPSGLTQNVKDFLLSREVSNIVENSDFIYMLNQAAGDREILAKQLGISPH
ncbi:MAG: conjugal transfer protein TraE, partial [Defluviitaleaceae bacterium]|nr:conjugal transfer protein TraE [Defluviitaleaceae bacterium]